mgnify:CR=1 FL=1
MGTRVEASLPLSPKLSGLTTLCLRACLPLRSWTAAMSNPEAFGINDDTGGAPVHIYVREGA